MNTVHASQTNELELTSSDYVVFEVLQRTKFESQFSQDITFIGDRTSSSKSIDHRQFCEILRFMLKTTAQLLHSSCTASLSQMCRAKFSCEVCRMF